MASERLADCASVDAVLLTHGDAAHAGALACARALWPDGAGVRDHFVRWMGQLSMYDAHEAALIKDADEGKASRRRRRRLQWIRELKFAQVVTLPSRGGAGAGALSAIAIAPHPAGHTVGGCFWRVTVGAEEVLYCPEYNHQHERHLPPGTLHAHAKPSLLIAPARTALTAAQRHAPRAFADLVAALRARRRRPATDTAGRCLELLLLLEAHWRARRGGGGGVRERPIVLLHSQAATVLAFARSQIEWMGEEAVRAFDSRTRAENLFELRHVHACTSLREVAALPSPKVVLATSADLGRGLAAQLLPAILTQPNGLCSSRRRRAPRGAVAAEPTPPSVELTVSAASAARRRPRPTRPSAPPPPRPPPRAPPPRPPPPSARAEAEAEAEAAAAAQAAAAAAQAEEEEEGAPQQGRPRRGPTDAGAATPRAAPRTAPLAPRARRPRRRGRWRPRGRRCCCRTRTRRGRDDYGEVLGEAELRRHTAARRSRRWRRSAAAPTTARTAAAAAAATATATAGSA